MARTTIRMLNVVIDQQRRRRRPVSLLVLSEFQIEVLDEIGDGILNSVQLAHRLDAAQVKVLSALHILESHGVIEHTPYLGWEQT